MIIIYELCEYNIMAAIKGQVVTVRLCTKRYHFLTYWLNNGLSIFVLDTYFSYNVVYAFA